jgi:hypothetical protein
MQNKLVAARRARVRCSLALSGCVSHNKPDDKSAASWSAVRWSGVVSLVRHCRVTRVDQMHSRLVTVTLRDGRKAWAREPPIDAIIPVVNRANAHCGPITFATE